MLKPPLVVRSRKSGDSIPLPGGRKSVKKLLSEWKVPLNLRPVIPVIEDREGILAVIGGPFGYKTRFSSVAKESGYLIRW